MTINISEKRKKLGKAIFFPVTIAWAVLIAVYSCLSYEKVAEITLLFQRFLNFCLGLILPHLVKDTPFFKTGFSEIFLVFILYAVLCCLVWNLFLMLIKDNSKNTGKSVVLSVIVTVLLAKIFNLVLPLLLGNPVNFINLGVSLITVSVNMIFIILFYLAQEKFPKILGRETFLYVFFGVLTTLVNIVSFTLLGKAAPFNLVVKNVIAWVLSVAFAYVTNKIFVFKSEAKGLKANLWEMWLFVSVRLFSLLAEMAALLLLATLMGIDENISKIIASVIVLIMNYVFSKLVVFKKKDKNKT